jgi:hypothetical protein
VQRRSRHTGARASLHRAGVPDAQPYADTDRYPRIESESDAGADRYGHVDSNAASNGSSVRRHIM